MLSTVMSAEVARYRALAEEIRAAYAGIDDETLADTLEGISSLPDLLVSMVRSSLSDEDLLNALKSRLGDMKARFERLEERVQRKRDLVCETMGKAGLDKLTAEDFSISRRQGVPKLEVVNEALVPPSYLILQPPRLDRAGLLSALKRGEQIAGVRVQNGQAHIQVRAR